MNNKQDKISYITLQSNTDNKTFLVGVFLVTTGLTFALGFGGLVAGIGVAAMMLALVDPHDWDEES
jgi:hypothetical protein